MSIKRLENMIEMAMATMAPSRGQMHQILSTLRGALGVRPDEEPVWRKYLAFSEGGSNKFHYFAVFPKGSIFVAANAYGRIGYPAQVNIIGSFPRQESAIKAAEDKMGMKVKKGYDFVNLN